MKPTFHLNGDHSFILRFGKSISPVIHAWVKMWMKAIQEKHIEGVSQLIPSYTDISVVYNPEQITYPDLLLQLKTMDVQETQLQQQKVKLIHIPVLYGGDYGPDMEYVANQNRMTVKEVIQKHSAVNYLVYMLGFTPGFVYLGGLHPDIATPRKEVPRQEIKAGAVGIAGDQTGIYPIVSPGGWQIIGQTPIRLFDINRQPEVLVEAGDYLCFNAISQVDYEEIEKQVLNNEYCLRTELIEPAYE
jgi:KipI family sensor histidine kinase inhibitor